MIREATFSEWNMRTTLTRIWDSTLPRVAFVGLNPGLADGQRDDATARKYVGFAIRWGFGSYVAGNMAEWIATNPAELHERIKRNLSVNAPTRDDWLSELAFETPICLAYGSRPSNPRVRDWWKLRAFEIVNHISHRRIIYAAKNRDGTPSHLSRLGYTTAPLEANR